MILPFVVLFSVSSCCPQAWSELPRVLQESVGPPAASETGFLLYLWGYFYSSGLHLQKFDTGTLEKCPEGVALFLAVDSLLAETHSPDFFEEYSGFSRIKWELYFRQLDYSLSINQKLETPFSVFRQFPILGPTQSGGLIGGVRGWGSIYPLKLFTSRWLHVQKMFENYLEIPKPVFQPLVSPNRQTLSQLMQNPREKYKKSICVFFDRIYFFSMKFLRLFFLNAISSGFLKSYVLNIATNFSTRRNESSQFEDTAYMYRVSRFLKREGVSLLSSCALSKAKFSLGPIQGSLLLPLHSSNLDHLLENALQALEVRGRQHPSFHPVRGGDSTLRNNPYGVSEASIEVVSLRHKLLDEEGNAKCFQRFLSPHSRVWDGYQLAWAAGGRHKSEHLPQLRAFTRALRGSFVQFTEKRKPEKNTVMRFFKSRFFRLLNVFKKAYFQDIDTGAICPRSLNILGLRCATYGYRREAPSKLRSLLTQQELCARDVFLLRTKDLRHSMNIHRLHKEGPNREVEISYLAFSPGMFRTDKRFAGIDASLQSTGHSSLNYSNPEDLAEVPPFQLLFSPEEVIERSRAKGAAQGKESESSNGDSKVIGSDPGASESIWVLPVDFWGPCREMWSWLLVDFMQVSEMIAFQGVPFNLVAPPFTQVKEDPRWKRADVKESLDEYISASAPFSPVFFEGERLELPNTRKVLDVCRATPNELLDFSNIFDFETFSEEVEKYGGTLKTMDEFSSANALDKVDVLFMIQSIPQQGGVYLQKEALVGPSIPCKTRNIFKGVHLMNKNFQVARTVCVRHPSEVHSVDYPLLFKEIQRARNQGFKYFAFYFYFWEGPLRAKMQTEKGAFRPVSLYPSLWSGLKFSKELDFFAELFIMKEKFFFAPQKGLYDFQKIFNLAKREKHLSLAKAVSKAKRNIFVDARTKKIYFSFTAVHWRVRRLRGVESFEDVGKWVIPSYLSRIRKWQGNEASPSSFARQLGLALSSMDSPDESTPPLTSFLCSKIFLMTNVGASEPGSPPEGRDVMDLQREFQKFCSCTEFIRIDILTEIRTLKKLLQSASPQQVRDLSQIIDLGRVSLKSFVRHALELIQGLERLYKQAPSFAAFLLEMAISSKADRFLGFGNGWVGGTPSAPSLLVMQMRRLTEGKSVHSDGWIFDVVKQEDLEVKMPLVKWKSSGLDWSIKEAMEI